MTFFADLHYDGVQENLLSADVVVGGERDALKLKRG
jgi:hypothetical protein